ncbi:MAG: hypothetical protein AAF827_03585 [Cyanobacteria bacterium P01_D01_bin.6]
MFAATASFQPMAMSDWTIHQSVSVSKAQQTQARDQARERHVLDLQQNQYMKTLQSITLVQEAAPAVER